jgi:thiamine pyrophosphate-dependent acetolactate synthase large subunit-like protein
LLRIKQERRHFSCAGVDLGTHGASPAHYFGVPCRSASSPAEFATALDWALSLDGPSVIEAFVDPNGYSATVYD